MKTLTVFSIALVVFAAAPVFACGDSCDKDKDEQAFTINVQTLCGGDKGDKSDDKDAACLCSKPKPEPEPEPEPVARVDTPPPEAAPVAETAAEAVAAPVVAEIVDEPRRPEPPGPERAAPGQDQGSDRQHTYDDKSDD